MCIRDSWYSTAGYNYTANINVTANNWSFTDDRQSRHAGYIATSACKVNKVRFVGMFSSSTSTGAQNFEWAIMKYTPGSNGATGDVTTTLMTHTNNNGAFVEGSIYNLDFAITGNNTMAAGDALMFIGRVTSGTNNKLWRGNCTAEIELT